MTDRGMNVADRTGSDIAAVLATVGAGVGGNVSEERYLRTLALPVGDTGGDSRAPSLPLGGGEEHDGSARMQQNQKQERSVSRSSGTPNPGPNVGGGTNGTPGPSVSSTPTIPSKVFPEGAEGEEGEGSGNGKKKMDVS